MRPGPFAGSEGRVLSRLVYDGDGMVRDPAAIPAPPPKWRCTRCGAETDQPPTYADRLLPQILSYLPKDWLRHRCAIIAGKTIWGDVVRIDAPEGQGDSL